MVNRVDAGDVISEMIEWVLLHERGEATYYQGEPVKPDSFLLPGFQPPKKVSVASLGLCLIHHTQLQKWYLVPARQQVDAWEISAAYARLNFIPPFSLLSQMTTTPVIKHAEAKKVMEIFRSAIAARQQALNQLSGILLHINSNL